MNLSISNIAWAAEFDAGMYDFISRNGFAGIEIAPTRIFPDSPYDKIVEAKAFAGTLFEQFGLRVCSMQSIWFGRRERIFGEPREREILIEYTKKAFEFAANLGCKNLVFGCPKNRNTNSADDWEIAGTFFSTLGELAGTFGCVLALEANPEIYGTNFLNTTQQVFDFARSLKNAGITMNYDFGTVIFNQESVPALKQFLPLVSHVHFSEPYLNEVKFGENHAQVLKILADENWRGFVSIEMKNLGDIELVKRKIVELQKLSHGNAHGNI